MLPDWANYLYLWKLVGGITLIKYVFLSSLIYCTVNTVAFKINEFIVKTNLYVGVALNLTKLIAVVF